MSDQKFEATNPFALTATRFPAPDPRKAIPEVNKVLDPEVNNVVDYPQTSVTPLVTEPGTTDAKAPSQDVHVEVVHIVDRA